VTNVLCGGARLYRVRVTDACGDAFSPAAQLVIPIFGDLNGDCLVGSADLAILLGAWGPSPDCPADLDGDGEVGPSDLALLLGSWSS
jgi:hypothetical protein